MPECPVSMSGRHVPHETRPQNCKACGAIIGKSPAALISPEEPTEEDQQWAREVIARHGVTVLDGVRDGETYIHEFDYERLNKQMRRVWDVMQDGQWRTLAEIGEPSGYPEASVSARLRDFRKPRFGGHEVERRHRLDAERGLYEYRLIPRQP